VEVVKGSHQCSETACRGSIVVPVGKGLMRILMLVLKRRLTDS